MNVRRIIVGFVLVQLTATALALFTDDRSPVRELPYWLSHVLVLMAAAVAAGAGHSLWKATALALTILVAQFVIASISFLPMFSLPPPEATWTNSQAFLGYVFATVLFLPIFTIIALVGAALGRSRYRSLHAEAA